MKRYRITAEEVLILELLFLASIEEGHKEFLVEYYKLPVKTTNIREVLIKFQNVGIISRSYRIPDLGQKLDVESIIFNKNFLHDYKKFSGDLGAEFYEVFPKNGIIGGNIVVLNTWSKKFCTEEDFYFAYGKSIGWKESTHKEVLQLVEWAKSNCPELLNINIADFVVSKLWRNIQEMKDGHVGLTFDTIKSI